MKTIFIATLPRTGSSLLSADMRSTASMGLPREYLNPGRRGRLSEKWGIDLSDLDGYIAGLREHTATANGVLAIKLMVRHLELLHEEGQLERPSGWLRELSEHFGEVVIVKLLRRDKLRQSISLTRAQQTGKWGVLKQATGKAKYDRAALAKNIVALIKFESQWDREFEASGMEPAMTLYYEDLPSSRDETLLQIAKLLELPDGEKIVEEREREDVRLQRQADELTEEWVNRFTGNAS